MLYSHTLMHLINKNNNMNYLTLFLLSTLLLLTACGADDSSPASIVYDEGEDIEISTDMIAKSRLALGYNHSCFLTADNGSVMCWGDNKQGQLGNEAQTELELRDEYYKLDPSSKEAKAILEQINNLGKSTPTTVKDSNGKMTGAIEISASENHTCALLEGGNIKCWGNNSKQQLGNTEPSTQSKSASSTAVEVTDIQGAISISASNNYNCALLEGNSIKCWGTLPSKLFSDELLAINSKNPAQLATASSHACATVENNQIQCWGDSSKLGHSESEATEVTGIDNALFVSSKGSHSCALLNNGRVRCWGSNLRGQIGNGDGGSITSTVTIPSKNVINLSQVVSLSSGENYNCAVTQLGQVKCWGNNDNGQLGFTSTGSYKQQFYPQVAASRISTAEEVSVSQNHSCARLKNDDVYCWGKNDRGQLGNGTQKGSDEPVRVTF